MNKRELLKFGAGGAAALTQVGGGSPAQLPPSTPGGFYPGPEAARRTADAFKEGMIDPFYAAKAAMMQTAQEEASRQENLLRKAQQRLNRLNSTSPAWREAMWERYEQEKRGIYTRLDQARQFIFG